jgi:hypothetical protein
VATMSENVCGPSPFQALVELVDTRVEVRPRHPLSWLILRHGIHLVSSPGKAIPEA